jgi:hypothetical protein
MPWQYYGIWAYKSYEICLTANPAAFMNIFKWFLSKISKEAKVREKNWGFNGR